MDALRKMTLMAAQRLEARVPAMAGKGRIKVGADADLAMFEAVTVVDNGLVTAARPGKPIRAPALGAAR